MVDVQHLCTEVFRSYFRYWYSVVLVLCYENKVWDCSDVLRKLMKEKMLELQVFG